MLKNIIRKFKLNYACIPENFWNAWRMSNILVLKFINYKPAIFIIIYRKLKSNNNTTNKLLQALQHFDCIADQYRPHGV